MGSHPDQNTIISYSMDSLEFTILRYARQSCRELGGHASCLGKAGFLRVRAVCIMVPW